MATNENISGGIDELAGKAQGGVGDMTGDSKMQTDGKINELKGKAEQAFGKAKDAFAQAQERAREWSDASPEQLRAARERAQKLADEGAARARQAMQEQPLAVLAGGIALGFVVGWLVSGRKSY